LPRLGNPDIFNQRQRTVSRDRDSSNLLVQVDQTLPMMETNSQARTDWQSQQHPQIKQRYSTKHLLQIFKSLGRFQNPLETPETY